ncbi:MAG: SipW-dependent-type signal peptide-containing protein [Brevibacterium sp.]|uniref:SipW-dependent-type signal peptide-containing protein n=1 Tax=Brevibacterium TaxID=1696 RepID=UPI0013DDD385|nr:SipW-dependent-type signal peptide-containing protein [Brevibacterium aurantiacum]MBM6591340.1 hypothetical protein [Brevibacterium sp. RIT 803]
MQFPTDASGDPTPSERVSNETRSESRRRKREREQIRRRLYNRRIKAVLAGGLVFGIGAAATLAAWTDTEEATGSFKAGTFSIDLSVDASNWNNTSTMTFNATGMYPGSKVYAPVFIRTTPDTTIDGELKILSGGTGSTSGIAGALVYRAVTSSYSTGGYTCSASTFTASADYVYGGTSATTNLSEKDRQGAGSQLVGKASSSVRAYCFEVTLPTDTPSVAQGTSASNTWTFTANSKTPS